MSTVDIYIHIYTNYMSTCRYMHACIHTYVRTYIHTCTTRHMHTRHMHTRHMHTRHMHTRHIHKRHMHTRHMHTRHMHTRHMHADRQTDKHTYIHTVVLKYIEIWFMYDSDLMFIQGTKTKTIVGIWFTIHLECSCKHFSCFPLFRVKTTTL